MRISSLSLILDGEQITDFSKFKENEVEVAQTVDHFYGQDTVDVPPAYGFELAYLPKSGAERDWLKEKGKIMTLVVNYAGGNKVTYTGVKLLKFTPNELDGKTAKESQLVFSAADRK